MSQLLGYSLDERWEVETTATWPLGLTGFEYSVHSLATSPAAINEVLTDRSFRVSTTFDGGGDWGGQQPENWPSWSLENPESFFMETDFYRDFGEGFVDNVRRRWAEDEESDIGRAFGGSGRRRVDFLLARSLATQRLAVLGSPPRDWGSLGSLIASHGPFAAATGYYVQGGDPLMAVVAGATGYIIWFVKPTAENLRERLADRFKSKPPPPSG